MRKMLIRGFRHSNPPNLMRCLPLSLFFYQVSLIYHKILTTKKKLLILYVFFGIFLWLPTECVYALWKVSLQLFMIFHRGHCKKKIPFLILKRWINNSKEKFKDICDKNKDHIEYHKNDVKMQEMPLERN